MTNLEELKEAESNLRGMLESVRMVDSSSLLNVVFSIYLPTIAKSLAIIADKMSEKED